MDSLDHYDGPRTRCVVFTRAPSPLTELLSKTTSLDGALGKVSNKARSVVILPFALPMSADRARLSLNNSNTPTVPQHCVYGWSRMGSVSNLLAAMRSRVISRASWNKEDDTEEGNYMLMATLRANRRKAQFHPAYTGNTPQT